MSNHVSRRALVLMSCALMMCALSACVKKTDTTKAVSQTYPYVTSMPSSGTLNSVYKRWRHTLSPIDAYHFDIVIPKDWQILDTKAAADPSPGNFTEMGVFRQPGDWMNDEKAEQNAEISVSVYNAKGDKRTAAQWLEDTIVKNAPSYEILQKNIAPAKKGDGMDMLVKYSNQNKEVIINRIAAFKLGDNIYVISGNDTAASYRDSAEAFYVAIESFSLITKPKTNPFAE
jgi:hypothetical protein